MIASRHAFHRGRDALVVACLLMGVGGGLGSAAEPPQAAPAPLVIGSRRQLFVDRRLVDRLEGEARLVLHSPQPQEIAVRSEEPWEGSAPRYMTVFRDGDRYRLYYRVAVGHVEDNDERQYTCYAESGDGIRWTKPRLGLVEFAGSKENNIVWQGPVSHNLTPFRDDNPAAPPAERYKAVGGPTKYKWDKGYDPLRDGLMLLVSADGIHWQKRDDKPLAVKGNFDSQNVLFWDSTAGLYRIFWRDARGDSPQHPAGRDIRTATSPDCRTWSEREWLVYDPARSGSPDRDEAGDPTGDHHQLYTSGIQPYPRSPGLFVGLPERYSDRGWTRSTDRLPDREVRKARADKGIAGGRPTRWGTAITDVLFMASHDGRGFFVWPEAFVRPGIQRPGTWYYGGAWAALGFAETASPYPSGPPELSIYVQEADGPVTVESTRGAVRRHTLRLDGFASVHAPLTGGRLVTKPFVFAGDVLAINFSTSGGGRMRIGLADAAGEPVAGRSLDDCDLVYGDEHDRVVSWGGAETLADLAGQPVRLVVELKDADLYAIRFD
jgi:hypothetical protein